MKASIGYHPWSVLTVPWPSSSKKERKKQSRTRENTGKFSRMCDLLSQWSVLLSFALCKHTYPPTTRPRPPTQIHHTANNKSNVNDRGKVLPYSYWESCLRGRLWLDVSRHSLWTTTGTEQTCLSEYGGSWICLLHESTFPIFPPHAGIWANRELPDTGIETTDKPTPKKKAVWW